MLTQKVQQLLRPGKEPPGNDDQGGLGLQSSVDILDRDIKIEGSLIADAVGLRKGKCVGEDVDEIQHRAVAHQHSLGQPRGAGSKVDIEGVGVDHRRTDRRQLGLILLADHQLIHQQDGGGGEDLFHHTAVGLIGDHAGCTQHGLDLLQPRRGQFRVKIGVEAAGVYHAKKGAQGGAAFFHMDGHRLPGPNAPGQGGAHRPADMAQFLVAEAVCLIHTGSPLRRQRRGPLQVLKHVSNGNHLPFWIKQLFLLLKLS